MAAGAKAAAIGEDRVHDQSHASRIARATFWLTTEDRRPMTAFACIFVPDFPVQALLRVEPDLRSQAVAVLDGKAPLEKVFAVSEQARCAGVAMGMTNLQVEACSEHLLSRRSPFQHNSAHATSL